MSRFYNKPLPVDYREIFLEEKDFVYSKDLDPQLAEHIKAISKAENKPSSNGNGNLAGCADEVCSC